MLKKLLIICFALLVSNKVVAAEIVAPGIHPKGGAGAGQTISRGPSALFYNPANLIFSKWIELYADGGMATLSYGFLTIDENFEATQFQIQAPVITAGLGFRPIPSLSFGLAFTQPVISQIQAANVPLDLDGTEDGSLLAYNYFQKSAGMRIAGGAAFRLAHPLSIGAGMIYETEKTAVQIIDENEEAVVDELYEGAWTQFVGGVRSEIVDRQFVLALSYRTAAVKKYKGNAFYSFTESEDFEPFQGVGYSPAAIGGGAEARFGPFGAFGEVVMEQWSAARPVARRGFESDPFTTDLKDTMNIAGGAKLWFGKHMLQVGFGLYPSPIGLGVSAEQVEAGLVDSEEQIKQASLQDEESERIDDGRVAGVRFGDVNVVDRTVFGGGYRIKIHGTGYFHSGFSVAQGQRSVPEGSEGAGIYTLNVMVFGVGLAFGF